MSVIKSWPMVSISPAFLDPLRVEQLAEDRWELIHELRYDSAVFGARIIIPLGFVTDFESVPRWLPIAYAALYGGAHAAGVIHDYLYQTHLVEDRKLADRILDEAMEAPGPGLTPLAAWRRAAIYAGVRVGGQTAWNTGPDRYTRLGNPH